MATTLPPDLINITVTGESGAQLVVNNNTQSLRSFLQRLINQVNDLENQVRSLESSGSSE